MGVYWSSKGSSSQCINNVHGQWWQQQRAAAAAVGPLSLVKISLKGMCGAAARQGGGMAGGCALNSAASEWAIPFNDDTPLWRNNPGILILKT